MACSSSRVFGVKFIGIAALSLLASVAIAPAAYAGKATTTVNAKSQANLVAKAHKESAATSERYLGTAPYICTPSGFGTKARCFRRADARSHG